MHCVTWNQAREHQPLNLQRLFPEPNKYNIIAFGAQECVKGDREEQCNQISSYLDADFVKVGFAYHG